MRIGINALFLIPGKVGGSETYVRALVRALQELGDANEYILYTNRENAGTFELVNPRFREVRCPVVASNRAARMGWEQLVLPLQALRDRLDVLHSPGYTGPLVMRCASVVSILDLNYHFHPEDWTRAGLMANRLLIPRVAKAATHILTISECSRRAIIDVLGVSPAKITVSLLGVDRNLVEPAPHAMLVERFGLDRPYLFTVTASHPHKNVDGLFRAYETACRGWADPPPLVVVGIRGRHQERLERIVRGWSGGGHSRRFIAARGCSRSRRSTKASGSRSSRRCRSVYRSCHRIVRLCPRSVVMRRRSSIPMTSSPSRGR
jgi:glycosyltransferase involved in cell wall biosynthesis